MESGNTFLQRIRLTDQNARQILANSIKGFGLVMSHQDVQPRGIFRSQMMAAVGTENEIINCLEMSL